MTIFVADPLNKPIRVTPRRGDRVSYCLGLTAELGRDLVASIPATQLSGRQGRPTIVRLDRDLDHARAEIGQFIDLIYNRQRLHSALDYLSPEEFESTRPRPCTAQAHPTALLTAIQPTAATTTVTI